MRGYAGDRSDGVTGYASSAGFGAIFTGDKPCKTEKNFNPGGYLRAVAGKLIRSSRVVTPARCDVDITLGITKSMLRRTDTQALLDRAAIDIELMSIAAAQGQIDKIQLKNTLENLRSALDYVAQDIRSSLHLKSPREKLPERVHFPYGQRPNHFKNSIQKNLPTLARDLPAVHTAISGRQPFNSGDSWLVDLCKITNEAKHDRLNETKTYRQATARVPGLGQFIGSDISLYGNFVNGLPVDDVHIRDGELVSSRKGLIGVTVTSENKILLLGKQIEVVPFLKRSHSNLVGMITEIYSLL